MLLFLTFTSLIHLEFFPVYYVGNGSSFILFHMALYLFQCYFLADHHFLTDLRSHFSSSKPKPTNGATTHSAAHISKSWVSSPSLTHTSNQS